MVQAAAYGAGCGGAVASCTGDIRDRDRLRRTFEGVAGSYQRARPEYPAELFDDLLAVTGLPPGDRVLEIGRASCRERVYDDV